MIEQESWWGMKCVSNTYIVVIAVFLVFMAAWALFGFRLLEEEREMCVAFVYPGIHPYHSLRPEVAIESAVAETMACKKLVEYCTPFVEDYNS